MKAETVKDGEEFVSLVSIPYRFNERLNSFFVSPAIAPFQFLIGSMKERLHLFF